MAPAKRRPITFARRVVQLAVLALFCVPTLAAGLGLFGVFSGVDDRVATASALPFFGTLSSTTIFGITLMDPFAALQMIAASKSFDVAWLVAAVPVLVVYGLIRGRVFCGWVCPVNLVLEGVDWVARKTGRPRVERALPRHAKLWTAVGVLAISALSGTLMFEAFSPISAINKGIVFGSLTGVVVLCAIIILEVFWARRVWCRALCPLGGFYEALGALGCASVKMDAAACTHCDTCRTACLCDPEILNGVLDEGASRVVAGDCMLCGACVDACPTNALQVGIASPFPKR